MKLVLHIYQGKKWNKPIMNSFSFRKNLVYIQAKVIYIGKKVNQLIANQVTRCLNSVMNILYKLSTFFLVNICTFSFLSEKDSCQTDMHEEQSWQKMYACHEWSVANYFTGMRESSDKKKRNNREEKLFKQIRGSYYRHKSKLQLNIRVFCSRVSYGPDLKTNKKKPMATWASCSLGHLLTSKRKKTTCRYEIRKIMRGSIYYHN